MTLAAARNRKPQKKRCHIEAGVICAPKSSNVGRGQNMVTNQTLTTTAAPISNSVPEREIRFGSCTGGSSRGFQYSRASSLKPVLSTITKASVVKKVKNKIVPHMFSM